MKTKNNEAELDKEKKKLVENLLSTIEADNIHMQGYARNCHTLYATGDVGRVLKKSESTFSSRVGKTGKAALTSAVEEVSKFLSVNKDNAGKTEFTGTRNFVVNYIGTLIGTTIETLAVRDVDIKAIPELPINAMTWDGSISELNEAQKTLEDQGNQHMAEMMQEQGQAGYNDLSGEAQLMSALGGQMPPQPAQAESAQPPLALPGAMPPQQGHEASLNTHVESVLDNLGAQPEVDPEQEAEALNTEAILNDASEHMRKEKALEKTGESYVDLIKHQWTSKKGDYLTQIYKTLENGFIKGFGAVLLKEEENVGLLSKGLVMESIAPECLYFDNTVDDITDLEKANIVAIKRKATRVELIEKFGMSEALKRNGRNLGGREYQASVTYYEIFDRLHDKKYTTLSLSQKPFGKDTERNFLTSPVPILKLGMDWLPLVILPLGYRGTESENFPTSLVSKLSSIQAQLNESKNNSSAHQRAALPKTIIVGNKEDEGEENGLAALLTSDEAGAFLVVSPNMLAGTGGVTERFDIRTLVQPVDMPGYNPAMYGIREPMQDMAAIAQTPAPQISLRGVTATSVRSSEDNENMLTQGKQEVLQRWLENIFYRFGYYCSTHITTEEASKYLGE